MEGSFSSLGASKLPKTLLERLSASGEAEAAYLVTPCLPGTCLVPFLSAACGGIGLSCI